MLLVYRIQVFLIFSQNLPQHEVQNAAVVEEAELHVGVEATDRLKASAIVELEEN